jgi:hypothetical protein
MNQYRCETCKRRIGPIDSSNDCPGGIRSHLDVPWLWLIEQIGCASHSDFQSERDTISKELALELCIDARKDVRDKVLDDFACWIKTEWVQESIKDYKADKPCK